MKIERLIRRRWLKWALFAGFWTLIGLLFAINFYLTSSLFGRAVTWGQAIGSSLGDWYVWAVLSFPIIWLARRFHFERANWPRSLAVHLVAGAFVSVSYPALRAWVAGWQASLSSDPVLFSAAFKPLLVKSWHYNLLIYWVIVSVSHAFDYYQKFQDRELRGLELEKRLTEAKLQALQMQLNPHFLFNTLHGISSLMHRDVEAADRMLIRLSDLLRRTLDNTGTQEVPLQDELDFLKRYLEIEQTRFGDRLTVRMDIAPDTLNAQVPNLVLQPLVENAIRHGIEPHAKPGLIELRARRFPGKLELQVSDNGAGIARGQAFEEGVGLSNTRARLQQLYGKAHRFDFSNGTNGGLVVSVTIPLRLETNGTAEKSATSGKAGGLK
jgi:two-component system LytT family sensor kinase